MELTNQDMIASALPGRGRRYRIAVNGDTHSTLTQSRLAGGAYRGPRPQRLVAETGQSASLQPAYRLLDKHTLKHRLRVSTRKLREVSCAK